MQNTHESVGKIEPMFGDEVRSARREIGWSQARVAEELSSRGLKLDATAITRIEKGQRSVRLSEAVTIASVLGIELEPLVARVESPLDAMRFAIAEQDRSIEVLLSTVGRFGFNVLDMLRTLNDDGGRAGISEATGGEVRDVVDYPSWLATRIREFADAAGRLPIPEESFREVVRAACHEVVELAVPEPSDRVEPVHQAPKPLSADERARLSAILDSKMGKLLPSDMEFLFAHFGFTKSEPVPLDDLAERRQRQADAIAEADARGANPVEEGHADAAYTHRDDRELDEQPNVDDEDYPDEPGPEEGA